VTLNRTEPLTSVRIVPKPWGEERIFAATERYAGKIITIRAGESMSYQFHHRKHESVHVIEGVLKMEVERDGRRIVLDLPPGETFHIEAGMRHRMFAGRVDCRVIEVSTPELDDVVRLEDVYGREGTSKP
jgi:mannose-6-phosphate isomerase-like protein (cupin superfamily)